MLILVTTGHPQAVQHSGPGFGRLVQPRSYGRVRDTAAAGIPWAADNDCFQGLDAPAYTRMLDALVGLPGCRFVTVPDVVADATETRARFEEWIPELDARGLPAALVAQDGLHDHLDWLDATWDRIASLFVGGSNAFKLGSEAEGYVREAKRREKWVHMGRVNSRKRFDYAHAIGCDSVDGTMFSQWRDRWLPEGLTWHRDHLQQRLSL